MSVREQDTAFAPANVWSLDRDAFRQAFGKTPYRFAHWLTGLPGFDAEAVTELAGRVPASWSRPHSGDVPVIFGKKVFQIDTSAADVARTITERRNRLGIYYLERIQPYRKLVLETRDEIVGAVGNREGGACGTSLGFFLASPGTVVQSHFDRHHNMLFQLQGTKELTVAHYDDPTDDQRVIERARRNNHDNLSELPPRTQTFLLGPGDALYIPPYAFHWVHGGDGVSVALTYGLSTQTTLRAPLVYSCNANLRRLGIRPRPPGSSERVDRAKAFAITRAVGARDAVLGFSRRGRRDPAEPASAR